MLYLKGFSNRTNVSKWLEQKEKLELKIYESNFHQIELLKKYKLPATPGFLSVLKEYILTNDNFKITNDHGSISCALEIPSEKEVKKNGSRYVKIQINEMATQEDIQKYIKKVWPIIKSTLNIKKERTKPTKHPDLIIEVLKLNRLPISKLYRMAKIDKSKGVHTKYQLISKILMLKISGEGVKKLVDRYKKSGTYKP
jgi:hypothetical protein